MSPNRCLPSKKTALAKSHFRLAGRAAMVASFFRHEPTPDVVATTARTARLEGTVHCMEVAVFCGFHSTRPPFRFNARPYRGGALKVFMLSYMASMRALF